MSYIVIFFSAILFCNLIIVIFVIICVYSLLLVALFYKFFQFLQGSPAVDQLLCHLHTCFNGSCFACNIKCGTSIQANCMTFRTCLFAFQNCFCDSAFSCGFLPEAPLCAALRSNWLRSEYIGCKFAIFDLTYRSRCTHGNFIQTVLSEDNHSSCYSKICHNLQEAQQGLPIINTHQLILAPAGLLNGPRILNTVRIPSSLRIGATYFIVMIVLGKQEADSDFFQKLLAFFPVEL